MLKPSSRGIQSRASGLRMQQRAAMQQDTQLCVGETSDVYKHDLVKRGRELSSKIKVKSKEKRLLIREAGILATGQKI